MILLHVTMIGSVVYQLAACVLVPWTPGLNPLTDSVIMCFWSAILKTLLSVVLQLN